ncbi:hypothetical protein SESBI_19964 [Sesbania bispinosa]|nr:hypothetical protein SESBI_19964 [Sesbania bispinosa]
MAGSSKSSSASGFSRKRCGCGDDVVVFMAGQQAKKPREEISRFGPNWKGIVVCLSGWRKDDKLGDLLGGGCCNSLEMLIENSKVEEFQVAHEVGDGEDFIQIDQETPFNGMGHVVLCMHVVLL